MTLDLEKLLQEQMQFIYLSAKSFDEGFVGEAKRLAVTVRVLLHDTKTSHSLLSQLGMKGIDFHTTSAPWDSKNLLAHLGLLTMKMSNDGASYVANLDDIPPPFMRTTPFDEWWNEIVFDDRKGNQLKRRDIVLGLANKEGGAHVDPNLNSSYKEITRNSQFWCFVNENGSKSFDGKMEFVAMRQIAHEVFRTLEIHAAKEIA